MILHPAHLDQRPGTISLEAVSEIAKARGVPILVDAAYMNFPTAIMAEYVRRGGDLVAISAKYFGGPNAGGFLFGRPDLVQAVSNVHFTRYESGKYLKFGRPLKMDRQTVVAVTVALEEWLSMDHDARLAGYRRLVGRLQSMLSGIPGLKLEPRCFTMDERFVDEPVNSLLVIVDAKSCGMSASDLASILESETPSIVAIQEGDRIGFVMDVLDASEVEHIAARVRSALER
jgi:L-seryl-tRNA(Ser) seleniumtransferase